MASLAGDIQRVLDLAADFTPRPSPAMRERASVLADLAGGLGRALDGPAGEPWRVTLGLRVRAGGQQGSVALVPWVRIYVPDQSPTAQGGIYLTYLFAADGSRAYLSLMHGSSEFRSGSMRAITDQCVLLARAAVARNDLTLPSGRMTGPMKAIRPGRSCGYKAENSTLTSAGRSSSSPKTTLRPTSRNRTGKSTV